MHIKIRDMTITALMAAALCLLAPWALPVGPVPLTLATFAVYILSAVVTWKHGVAAVCVYLLLGLVGLPVFSGFAGGLQRLVGPTGGYLIGYLPGALIIGCTVDRFPEKRWVYPLSMVAGTAAIYIFGTAWYIFSTKVALGPALAACVLPFLPGDGVKILLASLIAVPMRRRLSRHAKAQADSE